MTTDQRDIVEAMWNEGESIACIMAVTGVSRHSVYDYVRGHKDRCAPRKRGRKADPEKDKKAWIMWHAGMSREDIAKELGVSKFTVGKMVRRHDDHRADKENR